MRSIALVAPMHSGKTTLANLLVARGYRKIALADPLKFAARLMLNDFIETYRDFLPDRWDGLDGKQTTIPIDAQEMEDAKAVFRPLLQWLGTEFGRKYLKNDSLWIDIFRSHFQSLTGGNLPVVCDDVRFINEAQALRDLGFRIIRLRRPEEDRLESLQSVGIYHDPTLRHASETELESIDCDDEWLALDRANLERIADILAGVDRLAAA